MSQQSSTPTNPSNPPQIIVEFHSTNNQTLTKFKNSLSMINVAFREKTLDLPNRVNIYLGVLQQPQPTSAFQSIAYKYCPHLYKEKKDNNSNDKLIVSIIYQYDNNQLIQPIPKVRTILLRESLPQLINFHYEIETTLNEMETVKHLVNLAVNLKSAEESKALSYFDQKFSKFNSTTENPEKKDPREVWKNMIYQIHGMETGKVQPLVQRFPTLESLYRDLGGPRTIESISSLNQMDQEKKIKKSTIKKIEQIFLSMDANQKLMD